MTKYYSAHELCRLTSVSVRTLHHYDEINILTPDHRTPHGHRRYSEEDLLRLQQILTLKLLGFSLMQIKHILKKTNTNVFECLKMQSKALANQIDRLERIAKLLNFLIHQHEFQHEVDWQTVEQISCALKLKANASQEWYENYLTEMQLERYSQLAFTHSDQWSALFKEVKDNLHTDPHSEFGLQMVQKWVDLTYQMYGDQPELINKLWQAFKAGAIPGRLPYDPEVINYVTKAIEKLQPVE